MAKFCKGDMLLHLDGCDFALITTNSFIKRDGSLVMGRGIAKSVRDCFTGIDKAFGDEIKHHLGNYYIVNNKLYPKILAFQVKRHWGDAADLELIKGSTESLKMWAEKSPDCEFFLNFPGIGNGRLGRDKVLPIVEQLPDNVTVWEF